MKEIQALINVQKNKLVTTHAEACDVAPEGVSVENSLEAELRCLGQSGIVVEDYVLISENASEAKFNVLLEVDEDILKESSGNAENKEKYSFSDAFKGEFGWVSNSGIYLQSFQDA